MTSKICFLVALSLIPLVLSSTPQDISDSVQPTPEATLPSKCLEGKLLLFGQCGCKLLAMKQVKVRSPGEVKTLCKDLFGPKSKDVKNLNVDCLSFFRKNGGVKAEKVVKKMQKYLDVCYPGLGIGLTLKKGMSDKSVEDL